MVGEQVVMGLEMEVEAMRLRCYVRMKKVYKGGMGAGMGLEVENVFLILRLKF